MLIILCYQGRVSDTMTAESGSDVDDPCSPTERRSSSFPRLAPVHEEVSSCTFNLYLFLKFTSCGDIQVQSEFLKSNMHTRVHIP